LAAVACTMSTARRDMRVTRGDGAVSTSNRPFAGKRASWGGRRNSAELLTGGNSQGGPMRIRQGPARRWSAGPGQPSRCAVHGTSRSLGAPDAEPPGGHRLALDRTRAPGDRKPDGHPSRPGNLGVSVACRASGASTYPACCRALDKVPRTAASNRRPAAPLPPCFDYNDVALLGYGPPSDREFRSCCRTPSHRVVPDMQPADGSFGMCGPPMRRRRSACQS